jgi:ArsR family transcriptional regulator
MTTTDQASIELTRAAGWFHALSDETRLRIVGLLAGGERCVCELMDPLGAAQSRLSFHLKTLKTAGLVTDRREGRWVYYTLAPEALGMISAVISQIEAGSASWAQGGRCC